MSLVQIRAAMAPESWNPSDVERELIERAKRDPDAFARLYRQHVRGISDHVYRRTGDVHATEDLVADVFLTALRALPRFRYRGVPVRYWLLRIATNAVNRWARRRRRRDVVLPAEELSDAQTGSGSAGGDGELAQRALLALSPKFQAVLSLHYLEGLSVREVATVLGCREGTVKSRLARARDALRDRLQTWR